MPVKPWQFAIAYILAAIGVAILLLVVEYVFGASSRGAATIVPTLVAASWAGQRYAHAHKKMIPNSEAWKASFGMTAVIIAINAIFLLFAVNFIGDQLQVVWQLRPIILIGIFAFLVALTVLTCRFFVGNSVRSVVNKSYSDDQAPS